jgi:hypothetical protein
MEWMDNYLVHQKNGEDSFSLFARGTLGAWIACYSNEALSALGNTYIKIFHIGMSRTNFAPTNLIFKFDLNKELLY